jgi:hypothetical protein
VDYEYSEPNEHSKHPEPDVQRRANAIAHFVGEIYEMVIETFLFVGIAHKSSINRMRLLVNTPLLVRQQPSAYGQGFHG